MWFVEIGLTIHPDDTADDLRDFLLRAYAELRRLGRVLDPTLGAVLGDCEASYSCLVETDVREEAVSIASGAIRSALHAAGACTAGWDEAVERLMARASMSAQLVPA